MRNLFLSFVVAAILFFCYGCRSSTHEIIKADKMQAILWDMFQADAFTEQYIKKDSSKNTVVENARLQQQIFFINKVTKENFENSYAYYKARPDQFIAILDSITAKAGRERNTMMMKKYSGSNIEK
jgi:hypothetical protein